MEKDCKNVVLMVNPSEVGERALKKAIEIVKDNNCKKLGLLFVVDKEFFSGDSSGYVKPDFLVEKGLEGIGDAILDNVENTIKKTGNVNINIERIILHGETAQEILKFVQSNDIDMFIIPKEKRGPIEKFITGGDIGEDIDKIEKYVKTVIVE